MPVVASALTVGPHLVRWNAFPGSLQITNVHICRLLLGGVCEKAPEEETPKEIKIDPTSLRTHDEGSKTSSFHSHLPGPRITSGFDVDRFMGLDSDRKHVEPCAEPQPGCRPSPSSFTATNLECPFLVTEMCAEGPWRGPFPFLSSSF